MDTIVESCKKDNSYVILLKWGTIDEVQNKLQKKCKLIQRIGNMVEKYQCEEHEISFYRTGKMMVSKVEEIEIFLTKLLG